MDSVAGSSPGRGLGNTDDNEELSGFDDNDDELCSASAMVTADVIFWIFTFFVKLIFACGCTNRRKSIDFYKHLRADGQSYRMKK